MELRRKDICPQRMEGREEGICYRPNQIYPICRVVCKEIDAFIHGTIQRLF